MKPHCASVVYASRAYKVCPWPLFWMVQTSVSPIDHWYHVWYNPGDEGVHSCWDHIPTVDPGGRLSWENFFRAIPGISQYHHFQASKEYEGEIVCKEFANSDDVKVQILKKGINISSIHSSGLPCIVTPKGLDAQRQRYLYEQVRPFYHSNLARDITCPKPTVTKPSVIYRRKFLNWDLRTFLYLCTTHAFQEEKAWRFINSVPAGRKRNKQVVTH